MRHARQLWLSVIGLMVAACGAMAKEVRPNDGTGASVLDRADGACHAVSSNGTPLVVDWEAHRRADMEEAMHDGVAVVAYDCKSLRLLPGCTIDGSYGFMSVSLKEEVVHLDDKEELRANLPGGILATQLEAEMARGASLNVAMVLVGKKRTTLQRVPREALRGGAACEGATHYLKGAFIGAFALGIGTKGEVSSSAGVFASGSGSSNKVSQYRDGQRETCGQLDEKANAPLSTCNAVVRLELAALDQEGEETSKKKSERPVSVCPEGLTVVGGKCTRASADQPHLCRDHDLADCTTQCNRGDMPSCNDLGMFYVEGIGTPIDYPRALMLFRQACDAQDTLGCANVGRMYYEGRGVTASAELAAPFFDRACGYGNPDSCSFLGEMYRNGHGVRPDVNRATALYKQACAGGAPGGCTNLGAMFASGEGLPKDVVRASQLYKQACDGGEPTACANLGAMYLTGSGVPKNVKVATALLQRACDAGAGVGCGSLGAMYQEGKGVRIDLERAAQFFEQACKLGMMEACGELGTMYEGGKGVEKNLGRARSLYEQACAAGIAEGCSRIGGAAPPAPSLDGDHIKVWGELEWSPGKPTLKGSASALTLDGLKAFLDQHVEITTLRVEGHTDNTGSAKGALTLAGQRATAVKSYLVGRGVDPGRLIAVSFGMMKPIADNASAAGRSANRRMEFHIAELNGRRLERDLTGGGTVFP